MFHMIIKKKQIILACLISALAVALFLNWQISGENTVPVTGGTENSDTSSKHYGDAQLVNGSASEDYFAQVRIDRQKSRDEATQTLAELIDSGSLSEEESKQVQAEAAELASAIERESQIENVLKAKGFSECVVYIYDEQADVVVRTDGLVPSEIAKIRDAVIDKGKIAVENIHIVPTK